MRIWTSYQRRSRKVGMSESGRAKKANAREAAGRKTAWEADLHGTAMDSCTACAPCTLEGRPKVWLAVPA